jgi:tetratricopeptide (TPR) repeat protein
MKLIHILPVIILGLFQGCNRNEGTPLTATPGSRLETNLPPGAQSAAHILTFVGSQVCGECHQKETALFTGSHHDLAMQAADQSSILGDFDNASFIYNRITSRFYRRDGRYYVTTDGPDGELAEFGISYVLGVTPLQQYLIELPGGRLQALGIAWDSRPPEDGGQRWFHLYPDESIDYKDALHWTGANQNWNSMCAECHTTGYRKNYDPAGDTYQSRWEEINVACEACHGQGSRHVALARDPPAGGLAAVSGVGFPVDFSGVMQGQWTFPDDAAIARLDGPRITTPLIDVCARCHSRRTTIDPAAPAGTPLHDTHVIALLESGLYHPDGQVDGEVYEYGSFVQSKMHAAGVTCIDCHDPHSARSRGAGNSICARCHRSESFDTVRHHFHAAGTAADRCINCHMPPKRFMVIDTRHDHGFRVPRPDVSVRTGAPNPCNLCHADRSPQWAATAVKKWYGRDRDGEFHFAEAFTAARRDEPGAKYLLLRVIADDGLPDIVRAAAITRLGVHLGPDTIGPLQAGLNSDYALIRSASLNALEGLEPGERLPIMRELLVDPVKSVRIDAARLLAPFHDRLPDAWNRRLDAAVQEYINAQSANGERAYADVNLGNLYSAMGRYDPAEAHYTRAMAREPHFAPAYVNLAELHRLRGRERQAETVLRRGVENNPHAAVIFHALGLALVRQNRLAEALPCLEQAVDLEPDNVQYALVYAIGLNASGNAERALALLTSVYQRYPEHRGLLVTLATLHRDQGGLEQALSYAERLAQLETGNDRLAIELITGIRKRMNVDAR